MLQTVKVGSLLVRYGFICIFVAALMIRKHGRYEGTI